MKRSIVFGFAIMLVVVAGWLLWHQSSGVKLPQQGESVPTTVTVSEATGQVVAPEQVTQTPPETLMRKEIQITEGVKHSVPLDEIVTGCPGIDCIPSIDQPKYENTNTASEWLRDDDLGLQLVKDGVARFYPYRILVSHEIVNDTIGGERVLVTYCPLCFTGIVFDPLVEDSRVEFGVSGKLRNSNLIMYDRATNSLWSQVTGEAIVGEQTGSQLKIIPSDITKFGLFQAAHPQGEVLSRDTGRPFASYSSVPYGGDLTDIPPFLPLSHEDDRLPETAYVLGVVLDDSASLSGRQAKAYHVDAVKQAGSFTDTIGRATVTVAYEAASDSVTVTSNGERLPTIPAFWFSWVATHPETALYP